MLKRLVLLACLAACGSLHAEVASVEVTSRQPWAGGQVFGDAGAYEVLRGTVRYAIDPRSASAKDVTDMTMDNGQQLRMSRYQHETFLRLVTTRREG